MLKVVGVVGGSRYLTASYLTSHTMAEMDKITDAPVEFLRDGARFIQKCTKPSQKEYLQLIRAVGFGFIMMGVVGYLIKLIHIPIRYLIV